MPRRKIPTFIWIPKEKNTSYSITIDGEDVTADEISSEWTRALIGNESICKLTLIDTDGTYQAKYTGGEVIELKLDFGSGTLSQWKGTLDAPRIGAGDAYDLELVGSHFQEDLLDVTVTEVFNGENTADEILQILTDKYLIGFTYNNVLASTTKPTKTWENISFWDCVLELCEEAGFDAYVDSDKDIHFFERGSIDNNDEAVVWSDNLLAINNFGTNRVDIRNRIIVYGETGSGMPIVYQADDLDSQDQFGIKEMIIKDSNIKTREGAKNTADSELANRRALASYGDCNCIILPELRLGENTFFIHPPQNIHDRFKPVSYTHYLPNEATTVVFQQKKTIPLLFKQRKNAEVSQQNLLNPFRMTNSYPFEFDDESNIDLVSSSNILISESNLKVASGTTATMVSKTLNVDKDVSYVHIKVTGNVLTGARFYINAIDTSQWQLIPRDTETIVAAPGKFLRLKIEIDSASTLVESCVVMFR